MFQSVFILATVLALFTTFFAISGIGPIDQSSRVMIWLLGANAFLILLLGILVVRRYNSLSDGRLVQGGGRLAKRFVMLSSLAAVLPAALVAGFLGLSVARGLDYWFSDTVRTTVEETSEIARENVDNLIADVETVVRTLAFDLNREGAQAAITASPQDYRSYLQQQALIRGFDAIDVVNSGGQLLATSRPSTRMFFPPVVDDYAEAEAGAVAIGLYPSGQLRALFRLEAYDDAYVYILVDSFSPSVLDRLRRAEAAITDYRTIQSRSGRIGFIFAIGYAEVAVLVLLLSIRLGLEAAGQVTQPIGRLAAAAAQVREGDLNVRLPLPTTENEITTLTRGFNEMTQRLQVQRSEIEAARQETEDRRAFLAAVLSDVNAGVIRTDDQLNITIANPAAMELLGHEGEVTGLALSELVPEFVESAQRAMREQASSDVSVDLIRQGVMRYFRVKTSPDRTGGCVLTFDDTTRLVSAQRQMAWRDVARRIAHEIRNPLTPIQLSAERLQRRYRSLAPADDETFDKCTETILRQVGDIGRMVEEFSNFARMPKPSFEVFDLGPLLDAIAYSQRMVSPDSEVNVMRPDKPVLIRGDERLLGQAITNIVKNAAEAIARRPETDDFAGKLDISLDRRAGELVLAVEDNGPGFPETDRAKLLEPYVTNREGGTGLGLAIVARIIMDHGGVLALKNRADRRRGARVEISMPTESLAAPEYGERHNLPAGAVQSEESV